MADQEYGEKAPDEGQEDVADAEVAAEEVDDVERSDKGDEQ